MKSVYLILFWYEKSALYLAPWAGAERCAPPWNKGWLIRLELSRLQTHNLTSHVSGIQILLDWLAKLLDIRGKYYLVLTTIAES